MATEQELASLDSSGLPIPTGKLSVSLLTPERVLYDGHADSVVVPGHDGEVGILSHHVTMVSRLGAGIARITLGGKTTRTFLSGGFVQVAGDVVTILTDEAGDPAKIDREEAQATLEEALALPAHGEKAMNEKQRRLGLARARVRLANQAASG